LELHLATYHSGPGFRTGTFKEQILFGQAEETNRLNNAIKACALDVDVTALVDGLETEIGGGWSSPSSFANSRLTMQVR